MRQPFLFELVSGVWTAIVRIPFSPLVTMFNRFLPWIVPVCALAMPCFSDEEVPVPAPSVSISLHKWSVDTFFQQRPPTEWQAFCMVMKVSGQPPWKVIYCEQEENKLAMADSSGSASPRVKCSYHPSWDRNLYHRDGLLHVTAESWLPSAKAAWTEVNGEIPLVVSRSSVSSERVRVKLSKGSSVPLVLKNAGVSGEGEKGSRDVEAVLEVGEYKVIDVEKKRCILMLQLTASERIGFLDFELQAKDGAPVLAESDGSGYSYTGTKYKWYQHLMLEGEMEEELSVAVSYAAGLRKVMAPVHVRGGLFGRSEKKEIQSGKE